MSLPIVTETTTHCTVCHLFNQNTPIHEMGAAGTEHSTETCPSRLVRSRQYAPRPLAHLLEHARHGMTAHTASTTSHTPHYILTHTHTIRCLVQISRFALWQFFLFTFGRTGSDFQHSYSAGQHTENGSPLPRIAHNSPAQPIHAGQIPPPKKCANGTGNARTFTI